MQKVVATNEVVKVCDLCGEPTGETQWERGFQHIKAFGNERPLKTQWYHVLRFMWDGNPTYDVHHTCLYELLRAYQEGKLIRRDRVNER